MIVYWTSFSNCWRYKWSKELFVCWPRKIQWNFTKDSPSFISKPKVICIFNRTHCCYFWLVLDAGYLHVSSSSWSRGITKNKNKNKILKFWSVFLFLLSLSCFRCTQKKKNFHMQGNIYYLLHFKGGMIHIGKRMI